MLDSATKDRNNVRNKTIIVPIKTTMPKIPDVLTPTALKNAKPKDKPYSIYDGMVTGLHVLIQISGTKTFRLKAFIDGKEKRITLGQIPEMTLAEAREKAQQFRTKIKKEIDPTAKGETNTFGEIYSDFIDTQRNTRRKSEQRIAKIKQAIEKHVLPSWKDTPITKIKHTDTNSIIKNAAEAKSDGSGGAYIAKEVHRYVTWVFEHALSTGKIESLPVTKSTLNQIPRHTTKHIKTMAFERVGEFLGDLDNYGGTVIGKLAMKFIMLTAIRTIELRRLKWGWVDTTSAQVCIPAGFHKTGKKATNEGKDGEDFYVLLSQQALKTLEKARKITGAEILIFPSPYDYKKEASDAIINKSIERMGWGEEHSGHGFRSLFRSEMRKRGEARDILELCLNHSIAQNKTESAYQRGMNCAFFTERADVMQKWADLLDKQKSL